MKRTFTLILISLGMLFFLGGCKKTEFDKAQKIAEAYFEAIEAKNVDLAYGYLCDKALTLQAPDGSVMQFAARPDLEMYKVMLEKTPQIAVVSIEPRPDVSNPEAGLILLEVTARSAAEGVVTQSFMAYMGRNTLGEWSVMLPVPVSAAQSSQPDAPLER